jgi:hypothetical protein
LLIQFLKYTLDKGYAFEVFVWGYFVLVF